MKNVIESYLENNNIFLKVLLQSVFNLEIKNVTFLGECKLKKMTEYKFNLLKYNIVLEDFSNYTIFIKLVDKDKVEESLFCYWFFCEEYYGLNSRPYIPKANIINLEQNSYKIQYNMAIFNKNNILWKNSLLSFINLKEYCLKHLIKDKNIKQLNKSLFIAII